MSGDHEFNQVFFDDAARHGQAGGRMMAGQWQISAHHERAGKSATGMMMKVAQLRQFRLNMQNRFDLLSDDDYVAALSNLEIELNLCGLENRVFASVSQANRWNCFIRTQD